MNNKLTRILSPIVTLMIFITGLYFSLNQIEILNLNKFMESIDSFCEKYNIKFPNISYNWELDSGISYVDKSE